MVLCCICGVDISDISRAGARCVQCLQKEVDITSGISRNLHVHHCGTCNRWLQPAGQWVHAELESRELLALCLRHVKGTKKEHHIANANFLWTEPHSKELQVKLTVQQEVMASVVMQQTVALTYRINNQQCSDCKKSYTKHVWDSSVQVRQRAEHRRTLANLEQLIIQHKVHKQVINVQPAKDGLDFFFTKEKDAHEFISFIKKWAVVKVQESKKLISSNACNNSHRFKRTTIVEVCSVCRDDLVFLPPKTAQALGGLPSTMLCTKAASVISLVDPASSRTVQLSAAEYWKRPFAVLCPASRLTEFIVLDVNMEEPPTTHASGRSRAQTDSAHCEVEVARLADFGQNDDRLCVRSHLGNVLSVGDTAMGYDLRTINTSIDEAELGSAPPLDVYLVRKQRPPKQCKGGRARSADQPAGTDSGPDEDDNDEAEELQAAAVQMLDNLGETDRSSSADGGEVGNDPGASAPGNTDSTPAALDKQSEAEEVDTHTLEQS
mmetsp:Transcript_98410/g.195143  ORF Transcript_98410/g.195143 Transcript_98410/m.195143 type:complete len:494 (-) Transcript_98410:68-1549(-)